MKIQTPISILSLLFCCTAFAATGSTCKVHLSDHSTGTSFPDFGGMGLPAPSAVIQCFVTLCTDATLKQTLHVGGFRWSIFGAGLSAASFDLPNQKWNPSAGKVELTTRKEMSSSDLASSVHVEGDADFNQITAIRFKVNRTIKSESIIKGVGLLLERSKFFEKHPELVGVLGPNFTKEGLECQDLKYIGETPQSSLSEFLTLHQLPKEDPRSVQALKNYQAMAGELLAADGPPPRN